MPKKPPRDNPKGRDQRPVHSAASLLQRITRRAGVVVPPAIAAGGAPAAATTIERVRGLIPADLRPRLVSCIEKADELVLFAESAAWAGRLKLALAGQPLPGEPRKLTIRVLAPDRRS